MATKTTIVRVVNVSSTDKFGNVTLTFDQKVDRRVKDSETNTYSVIQSNHVQIAWRALIALFSAAENGSKIADFVSATKRFPSEFEGRLVGEEIRQAILDSTVVWQSEMIESGDTLHSGETAEYTTLDRWIAEVAIYGDDASNKKVCEITKSQRDRLNERNNNVLAEDKMAALLAKYAAKPADEAAE